MLRNVEIPYHRGLFSHRNSFNAYFFLAIYNSSEISFIYYLKTFCWNITGTGLGTGPYISSLIADTPSRLCAIFICLLSVCLPFYYFHLVIYSTTPCFNLLYIFSSSQSDLLSAVLPNSTECTSKSYIMPVIYTFLLAHYLYSLFL